MTKVGVLVPNAVGAPVGLTVGAPLPWAHGQDPAARYLARLAPGSRPAQGCALRLIARMASSTPEAVPWHRLTLTELDAIAAALRNRYAIRTANRMMTALRGVLDVCRAERWLVTPMDGDTRVSQRDWFDELTAHLQHARPRTVTGRMLSDDELVALLRSCDGDGIRGARDAAILVLGAGAGLRREEIADLMLMSVNVQNGDVAVVDGKGGKDRTAFLAPRALATVEKWIRLRGNTPGPLITRFGDGLVVTSPPTAVSPETIGALLHRRQVAAGVPPFTPHDLRRTFITRQLGAGTSYGSVQAAVGHENIQTTASYDRAPLAKIRAEMVKTDMPEGK